jgi:protein ImuA
MLFGPPGRPCAWTLPALGLDLGRLVIVQGRGQPRGRGARVALPLAAQDLLWALEQALASGQVGAALAWLPPRLPADALRRLQLAAQSHPGPVFLFREVEARSRPSAAPLRLQLAPGAPDELLLRIVKRRGPPLDTPLALALPPVLSAPARARALAQAPAGLRAAPGAQPAPAAA